ncbi:hypothetical protein ACWGLF_07250 [Streptomyces puniciscabiei]|jgi:hypothetical protein|nr:MULTISPECIES: hypothetical protein [Streptomyces]MCH0555573.1 hypothetical protein [Streptomyces sp. MUM 16J]
MKLTAKVVTEHRSRSAQPALEAFGAAGNQAVLVPGACCCCSGAVVRPRG